MEGLIIRKATEDDAKAMIEYLNIVGGESDNLMHGANGFRVPIERVENFIKMANSSKHSIVLIAIVGNQIVGRAALQGNENARTQHRANLSISVKKDFWHQGIATKMISELIAFSKEAGISVIELEVISDNHNAIALYEKLDFEKIGVYKNYFCIDGKMKNAILMNLYL